MMSSEIMKITIKRKRFFFFDNTTAKKMPQKWNSYLYEEEN